MGNTNENLMTNIWKVKITNRVKEWSVGPGKYSQEAMRNFQTHLEKEYNVRKMEKLTAESFVKDYSNENNVSKDFLPEEVSYYQLQIGVLRWMLDIGCTEIIKETIMPASQIFLTIKGY